MSNDDLITKLFEIFATKHDLERVKEEVLNHQDGNTDRILKAIDSFAGEIKDHRDKETVHEHRHDQITDRLDKIEKVSVVAHELK